MSCILDHRQLELTWSILFPLRNELTLGQLQKLPAMLRWAIACGAILLTLSAATQSVGKQPKDATEWFQRADDQMNLRTAGSTPLHMKVVFHALPGLVLDKQESSQIISGDGTYEETWVESKKWRGR